MYGIKKDYLVTDLDTNARIADELDKMDAYIKTHPRKTARKSHKFTVCPECGSRDMAVVDLRPLGAKRASLCKRCGHSGA